MATRGDRVVVRACGGEALIRRVWEAYGAAVVVTDDAGYRELQAGREAPMPIGVPTEDVFRYESGIERKIGTPEWRWDRLHHVA